MKNTLLLLKDLHNVCRYCLKNYGNKTKNLKPIFKIDNKNVETENIIDMTEQLLKIKMNISDHLPQFICLKCFQKLKESYNFQNQCFLSLHFLENIVMKEKQCRKIQKSLVNNKICNASNTNDCKLTTAMEICIKMENIPVEEFIDEQPITEDIKVKHLDSKFVQETLKSKTNNKTRKTIKNPQTPKICPICGIVQRHINSHMAYKHPTNGPYECDFCGKQFKTKRYIRRHFDIHMDIRKHKCSICEKSFVDTTSLRVHMLNHNTERKYLCKICNKTYRQSCALNRHMKSHLQQLDFKCKFCNLRFVDARGQKRHMLTHSTEYPHKCADCYKKFKNIDYLRRHRIAMHKTKNQFKCALCDLEFLRPLEFNAHKRHHEYKII